MVSLKNMDAEKCKAINRSKLGRSLKSALTRAQGEKRLICGLLPSLAFLEQRPEDVVLCVLPQTRPGDSANHIQAVLLQAFCFENYIPVLQIDSSEKLAKYCKIFNKKSRDVAQCHCAIITRDESIPLAETDPIPMSPTEQTLTNFYECTLEEHPRPVIQLPI